MKSDVDVFLTIIYLFLLRLLQVTSNFRQQSLPVIIFYVSIYPLYFSASSVSSIAYRIIAFTLTKILRLIFISALIYFPCYTICQNYKFTLYILHIIFNFFICMRSITCSWPLHFNYY